MKIVFEHKKFRSSEKIYFTQKVQRDSGKRKKKEEILKVIPFKSLKIN